MLIWNGWGILTAVIAAIGFVLGVNLLDVKYGGVVGLSIAAAVNFVFARIVNNPSKDRIVVDEKTGERLVLKNRSTLFWVPMEWWSAIIFLVGVLTYIATPST